MVPTPDEDEENEMKIRTGERHPFTEDDARVDQFKVNPLPSVDYAARALRLAQDNYFRSYPEARKNAADLLWEIEKVSPISAADPIATATILAREFGRKVSG